MNKFLSDVWALISSLKLIFLLFSVFLYPSLAGIAYWLCDSIYLAQFGISPDLLNRPFFSNPLTNIWLITYSIPSIIYFWGFISFLFPLGFVAILHTLNRTNEAEAEETPEINSSETENAESSKIKSFLKKWEDLFKKLYSAMWSCLAVFLIGLALLLLLGWFYLHLINKSKESAQKQIELFLEKNICIDRFDNGSVGCYGIPNEIGNVYLLISNDENHLAYLSKGKLPTDVNIEEKKHNDPIVTVLNKKTGEKIVRLFIKPS
ncbi:MAG: hypothetical protein EOO52_15465 [Gammaproteobacteria bacterium]|nr:MAG: hypothetical protein EOO52_15465 [Gammaproteobacteria bacterium]